MVCPKCLNSMILVNDKWYCNICGYEVQPNNDKVNPKIRKLLKSVTLSSRNSIMRVVAS